MSGKALSEISTFGAREWNYFFYPNRNKQFFLLLMLKMEQIKFFLNTLTETLIGFSLFEQGSIRIYFSDKFYNSLKSM